MQAYGLPRHRHLSEVEQQLSLAAGTGVTITFIPHLAPMNRGIHTTIVAAPAAGKSSLDLKKILRESYADEPFVRIREHPPETKHVTGTNFCDIALYDEPRTGRVVILSVIDNLVKGAAGQAVQCYNLRAGLPETEGLIEKKVEEASHRKETEHSRFWSMEMRILLAPGASILHPPIPCLPISNASPGGSMPPGASLRPPPPAASSVPAPSAAT